EQIPKHPDALRARDRLRGVLFLVDRCNINSKTSFQQANGVQLVVVDKVWGQAILSEPPSLVRPGRRATSGVEGVAFIPLVSLSSFIAGAAPSQGDRPQPGPSQPRRFGPFCWRRRRSPGGADAAEGVCASTHEWERFLSWHGSEPKWRQPPKDCVDDRF